MGKIVPNVSHLADMDIASMSFMSENGRANHVDVITQNVKVSIK